MCASLLLLTLNRKHEVDRKRSCDGENGLTRIEECPKRSFGVERPPSHDRFAQIAVVDDKELIRELLPRLDMRQRGKQ